MLKMRVSRMKVTKSSVTPADRRREEARAAHSPRESAAREDLHARMRRVARAQLARLRGAGVAVRARYRAAGERRRQGDQRPIGHSWRHSFVAQLCVCAVILASVLGFRALDTPLTNRITEGLSEVVTMEADIGSDLGRLRFVRDIVPESVLTFWEATGDDAGTLCAPLEGEIVLPFGEDQPGLLLAGGDPNVRCAADGTVLSVTRGEDGDYVLRVRHEGGLETTYALLRGVKVAEGDAVRRGDEIALAMLTGARAQLYFQALRDGVALDPTAMLQR